MENTPVYDSLSEAIAGMQAFGYTENLNLCPDGVENPRKCKVYPEPDLVVRHIFRFEGLTNPADSSILYAIETSDGHKGLLVDAYGAYSGAVPEGVIRKLRLAR